MEEISTDNLFLIEFLVARVDLDPEMIRYAADDNAGTCVTVQFLDNSPLNICEEDFSPQSQYDKDSENLKTGKSCLFSLTPEQVQSTLNDFDITVEIFKKNQGEKILVGTSHIPVTKLFKKLIRSHMSSAQPDACPVPPAEMIRDDFVVNNSSGEQIGDINMYVRVSCFGKQIVTRFQMNPKEKSILFKDKAGHSLYKYKKVGGADDKLETMSDAEKACGPRCPAGQCGMPGETGPISCGSGCASASADASSTSKRSKSSNSGGCCGGGGGCSGGGCG